MDKNRYTKPELRRRLRYQLLHSDTGGPKGEWTAKKAQLLVREYERQGGGYRRARLYTMLTSILTRAPERQSSPQ
ncbi:hypothetical protein U8335_10240 [Roseiconus lacunae]|uniref:Uncharacterized protein n=1 Tax=Roseiconus lacunae TaxID=2605694 RepID=A0ABT7PGH5_9BACT|nr:hypothetical protein [Roseiconus lacunae]MCD0460543.1 hypothetical protein [Roseiconus lacunae]MDM4015409.1 hypothetical protein [Roseiconus lacunae]WRQ52913.1 hypothetical protein U8335_10240 [Stieleria sp. HD01]